MPDSLFPGMQPPERGEGTAAHLSSGRGGVPGLSHTWNLPSPPLRPAAAQVEPVLELVSPTNWMVNSHQSIVST